MAQGGQINHELTHFTYNQCCTNQLAVLKDSGTNPSRKRNAQGHAGKHVLCKQRLDTSRSFAHIEQQIRSLGNFKGCADVVSYRANDDMANLAFMTFHEQAKLLHVVLNEVGSYAYFMLQMFGEVNMKNYLHKNVS